MDGVRQSVAMPVPSVGDPPTRWKQTAGEAYAYSMPIGDGLRLETHRNTVGPNCERWHTYRVDLIRASDNTRLRFWDDYSNSPSGLRLLEFPQGFAIMVPGNGTTDIVRSDGTITTLAFAMGTAATIAEIHRGRWAVWAPGFGFGTLDAVEGWARIDVPGMDWAFVPGAGSPFAEPSGWTGRRIVLLGDANFTVAHHDGLRWSVEQHSASWGAPIMFAGGPGGLGVADADGLYMLPWNGTPAAEPELQLRRGESWAMPIRGEIRAYAGFVTLQNERPGRIIVFDPELRLTTKDLLPSSNPMPGFPMVAFFLVLAAAMVGRRRA
jgi:hypothetical protein